MRNSIEFPDEKKTDDYPKEISEYLKVVKIGEGAFGTVSILVNNFRYGVLK